MSFKAAKRILPTQIYFHASRPIPSLSHARSVFRSLGQFGEMAEYRFMRVRLKQKLYFRTDKDNSVLRHRNTCNMDS